MSNTTRPTNSYDERYVVPLEASRRGAHRARVSPIVAALPVVAVLGVVVGAVALVWVFLGSLGGGTDSASTPPASTAAASSTAPGAASSAPASSPTAAPSSAAGTVDKTIPVAVYNGTSTSGLARKASTRLTAAGWTLGPVQSWTGGPVAVTTVYYRTEAQRASALSIVHTLGHGTAKLSVSKAGAGISAVIGADYPGAAGATTPTKHTTTTHTSSTRSPVPAPTDAAPTGSPSPTA